MDWVAREVGLGSTVCLSVWFWSMSLLSGGGIASRLRWWGGIGCWEHLSSWASGTPLGASEQSIMTAPQKRHTVAELPRPTRPLVWRGADQEPKRSQCDRLGIQFPQRSTRECSAGTPPC